MFWKRFAARSYSTAEIHKILLLPGRSKDKVKLLRIFGATIGENVRLYLPLVFMNAGKDFSHLSIGDNVYVGHQALFDLKDHIRIGSDVTLANGVSILTHFDVGEIPLATCYKPEVASVTIESNVFIGASATVLHGVTIGSGSIIGAGAVVTRNIESGVMAAGIPARKVKVIGEAG